MFRKSWEQLHTPKHQPRKMKIALVLRWGEGTAYGCCCHQVSTLMSLYTTSRECRYSSAETISAP